MSHYERLAEAHEHVAFALWALALDPGNAILASHLDRAVLHLERTRAALHTPVAVAS